MREWGCPGCGGKTALVQDTGHDLDGTPVRLRACTDCGTLWATEETPIAVSAYYSRNNSRRKAERRRYRKSGKRTCRWCEGEYRIGAYSGHVKTPQHEQALKPMNRDRRRSRVYQRNWARRRGENVA